jgi:hypothetical protein
LNLLRAARKTVDDALRNPLAFSKCLHYEIRRRTAISQLPQCLRRSGFPCPPNLSGAANSYLTPAAASTLLEWAESAKMASEVRHAAIRDTYDQARYQNVKHFRRLLLRSISGGTLDQSTLRAALGKQQPKKRMWGITGRAVLGVQFDMKGFCPRQFLDQLLRMSTANSIVQIVRNPCELKLWFRGPRQAGDFLVEWCTESNALHRTSVPSPPLQTRWLWSLMICSRFKNGIWPMRIWTQDQFAKPAALLTSSR